MNQCVKCGAAMEPVKTLARDAEFERKVIENACEAVGMAHLADSIVAYASKRVLDGPIQLPAGRNLVTEWFEEVADGFNYGSFELQRRMADPIEDDDQIAYLQEALRHSVLTYAALRKAAAD